MRNKLHSVGAAIDNDLAPNYIYSAGLYKCRVDSEVAVDSVAVGEMIAVWPATAAATGRQKSATCQINSHQFNCGNKAHTKYKQAQRVASKCSVVELGI